MHLKVCFFFFLLFVFFLFPLANIQAAELAAGTSSKTSVFLPTHDRIYVFYFNRLIFNSFLRRLHAVHGAGVQRAACPAHVLPAVLPALLVPLL